MDTRKISTHQDLVRLPKGEWHEIRRAGGVVIEVRADHGGLTGDGRSTLCFTLRSSLGRAQGPVNLGVPGGWRWTPEASLLARHGEDIGHPLAILTTWLVGRGPRPTWPDACSETERPPS